MSKYIVSLNDNTLKIMVNDNQGLRIVSAEASKDIAVDSQITNTQDFSKFLLEELQKLSGDRLKKYPLHFLVSPQDVFLYFVTVNKTKGTVEEQVIADIKEKLKDSAIKLDDLYFSYQKIAPFVYQFVAIKKEYIEQILEVSTTIGFELKSVVPWISLLPKYLNLSEPCIFISRTKEDQIVALSELNGIYFSNVYQHDKDLNELQELVKQLSVYKRNHPITKVYAINYNSFSLDPNYEVIDLAVPGFDMAEAKGYELHSVMDYMLSERAEIFETQLNLLNLLPLPAKTNVGSAVYAGAGIAAFALIVGAYFVFGDNLGLPSFGSSQPENTDNIALDITENAGGTGGTAVLSGQDSGDDSNKDSENGKSEVEQTLEDSLNALAEFEKTNIDIRIENGAGIAGIAGRTQSFLEDLGYSVVEIDNADSQDYTNTVVLLKQSAQDFAQAIKADLEQEYPTEISTENLEDDAEYDVLIIVGSESVDA